MQLQTRLQLLRDPQLLPAPGRSSPLNANDAALLALLAVDGPSTRERVIALLWPDEPDPGRARNALRQRLFRLRRSAGMPLVDGDEVLALDPAVAHDLQAPDVALAQAPDAALAGDLLGAFDYPAWPAFAAWLDSARAAWRDRRSDALAALASQLEDAERIAEALVCAERLVRDEPLLEHAQRRLMRLHYRRGDRAAALAVYQRWAQRLRAELDDTPAAETEALLRLIETSGALPVAAAPPGLVLQRPPRLVGRAREWQQVGAALDAGQATFVLGEPGMGKSRLLGDFAGAGWVHAAARPGDAGVPDALLLRLVQALWSTLSAQHPLDGWARGELARLWPALGPPAEGVLQPGRFRQALLHLLAQARPAGVALDDLHFADTSSLQHLPALVAAGGCWLLALRGHEQPAALAQWRDTLDVTRHAAVELGPLDAGAVHELLASLALPGIDASTWAPRVHRHSGGNPMFILETLRALLAGGLPQPGTALPLPDTLRRLVERRLAQLSPPALKLARVAALAGADFDVELAAAVLGLADPLDLLDAWRELETAQVLHERRFVHDVIFETVRDSVPAALRGWLHGRVAEWLAAHGGAALALARHWQAAGRPERAAAAFEAAAQQARQAGRLAEQARWLQAAADAHAQAGQSGPRFQALLQRAIAAREALSPEASLTASEDLVDAASSDLELAQAHLQVASCHNNSTRFDLALPEFERAAACASAAGDDNLAQHARYLHAMALPYVQGLPAALAQLLPLLPWAEAQPDPVLRHSFLSDLAILLDQSDQRQRARPFFERALAFFDATGDTSNAAATRAMFARSLLVLGDLGRARLLLEQAVRERNELADAADGPAGQGLEALNLARVYTELGQYGAALALLEPWIERLVNADSGVVRGAMALVLARVHAHMGQTARALALTKLVPEPTQFHQQATLLWTRALLQQEQPVERARLLDAALACYADTDLPFLRLPILFDRLACRPGADAVARLREAVADCERRELPAPQMLGRMRLVQVLLAQGDTATALDAARGIVDDLPRVQPVGCYLPELHQACAAAARAGGDMALAQRCHDAAVQWIAQVAQQQVPAAFRDSFAHRNAVNRALLTASLPGPGNA